MNNLFRNTMKSIMNWHDLNKIEASNNMLFLCNKNEKIGGHPHVALLIINHGAKAEINLLDIKDNFLSNLYSR